MWVIGKNFIYRNSSGDMRVYTGTVDLSAGAVTDKTTDIVSTKTIYSVEYIDSSGIVITTGLGEPAITTSGGYYVISVYSTSAQSSVNLRVIYR